MEYLVTMTTHVPAGTSEEAVADMRAREAGRSRDLAAEGHLLRLWRPPLQPGEWRTLGLFAAKDDGQLEDVLGSMPLRVWRTDEVTVLLPHANDPALSGRGPKETPDENTSPEFLTRFTVNVPDGAPGRLAEETTSQETGRTEDLADQGHLLRLWTLQREGSLGLWRAADATEIQAILESLPLYDRMTVETTPLSPHPNDPKINQI